MKRILVLMAVVVLAACQTSAPPSVAPAAPSGALPAPAADVPPETAAFQGAWSGKWDGSHDGKLVVQTVAKDGAVTGIYSWGDIPDSFKAGSSSFTGFVIRNVLTISLDADTDLTYTMQPDGTLAGTLFRDGTTLKGTFRKA